MQTCRVCKQLKSFSEFKQDSSYLIGVTSRCQSCLQDIAESKLNNEQTARFRERKWRKKMKAEGLCTRCGKYPLATRTSCSTCHQKRLLVRNALYEERRQQRVCWQCGKHSNGFKRCAECRQTDQEKKAKSNKSLRQRVIEFLGNKCACCGESTWRFLQLDHINGKLHKADFMKASALRDILVGKRIDIRVLCINCNLGREYNGGICPHEEQHNKTIDELVESSI